MSFIVDAVRFPVVLGFLLLLTSLPDPAYAGCQEQQLGLSFPGSRYGDAVATDGNTAVVGAWRYDVAGVPDAGAVFVHVFNGTNWEQQAQLVAETPTQDEGFGVSVAIDGDVLVAGMREREGTAPPSAYVFTRSGTTWTQQQRITPWDAVTDRDFGKRVALDGDYLAVGAPAGEVVAAGAVYVYRWDGTAWVQDERLQPAESAVFDIFGYALSLRGSELFVTGRLTRSVFVFRRDAGGWTQTATLSASNPIERVAFDGTTLVGGSPYATENTTGGAATIWERQGDNWSLPQQISADDGSGDRFGWGVAVSGSVAVIGAPNARRLNIDGCGEICRGDGAVYWFSRDATGWKQVAKTTPADYACYGYFGSGLAILTSDSKLLVGRPGNGTVLVYDALPIPDCNENGVPDACEAADVDCNENGIPDDCDIDSGFSFECNGNGIPDECERDCNANGVPDDCDLTAGTSTDCDENNNPDECDPDCDADGIPDACDPFAPCVPLPPVGCLLAFHGSFSQGYYYGSAVSIGDGYAFVGAADDGDCHTCVGGKAYAYRRDGADWVFDGQLTVPGQGSRYAGYVAVHGTTGFIRDSTLGTRVMKRDAAGWYHHATISGLDYGPLAFDGTHLVSRSASGAVVLAEEGGAWGVVAELIVSDPSANGGGVAIEGNTAVIGSFVFEHDGTTWVETAQLERFGEDDPCDTAPALGSSVSVSQDTIAIGDDLCCSTRSVPVYVYRKTNGTWAPEARLDEYSSWFSRVDVEGDSLIVANLRHVFIHRRTGTDWSPRAEIELPIAVSGGAPGLYMAFDAGVVLAASSHERRAWFLGAGSDCNLNGIADECDIASGSPDADGDGVMDSCDVCDGSDDTDGDNVPDACDLCPGGDDAIDTDGDGVPDDCDSCDNNSEDCDPAPLVSPQPPHDMLKNRYISIDSLGADQANVGKNFDIRVTLSGTLVNGVTAVGSSWWANAPDANCISILGPTQPGMPINWDACPTLHLTGCPIMPTSTYEIVPVLGGLPFGPALEAETQTKPGDKWCGDVVGFFDGATWTAAQGNVNIDDAVAALKTFQDPNAFNAAHVSVVDVHPNQPMQPPPGNQINKLVNINDVFQIILGFQGNEYPGSAIHLCTDP